MEKITLLNGSMFILVENGVGNFNDTLTLRFSPESLSLDEIEALFIAENTRKITVIDSLGETLAIFNDYTSLKSISKEKVVSTSETGETVESEVVTIILVKGDIRERVSDLETVVDEILVSMLEV